MAGGRTMKWGWWALCLLLQSTHTTTTTTTTMTTATLSAKGSPLRGFCFWTRTLADGRTHQTFLRWEKGGHGHGGGGHGGGGHQLVLYHGLWGADGHLQQCVVSRDAAVAHGYLAECQQQELPEDLRQRRRKKQHRHRQRRRGSQGGQQQEQEEQEEQLFSRVPQRTFSDTHTLLQAGVCEEAAAEGVFALGERVDTHTQTQTQTHTPVRHPRDLQSLRNDLAEEGSGSGSRQLRRRSRRGVMMIPGTLWCGSGNTAANYTDLGSFSQTDQCCRDHDHCKYTITSFRMGYGVFNANIFTLSHCECDNKFKQCLQQASDPMAGIVGYGYFNLLKMRCFEWSQRMECAQRNWWGRCVSYDLQPFAVVQEPTDFNSTLPGNSSFPYLNLTTEAGLGHNSSFPYLNLTTEAGLGHNSSFPYLNLTTEAGLGHLEPHPGLNTDPTTQISDSATTRLPNTSMSTSTTIPNSITFESDIEKNTTGNNRISFTGNRTDEIHLIIRTNFTQGTKNDNRTNIMDQRTNASDARDEHVGERTTERNVLDHSINIQTTTPSYPGGNSYLHPPVTTEAAPTGPQRVCSIYKFLDDCRLQVPPLQESFGLRNTELRTLYHCNCTKRLAEHLPRLEASGLHASLLDFVSESCFTLPHTQSSGGAPHHSSSGNARWISDGDTTEPPQPGEKIRYKPRVPEKTGI
ncbi:group 3 secretory phospholipase A2 [Engraulis encrasicolus]|uniref:group 3 secretory phospholipase A2 n=1 Tax=Engraulis encrasicolus TaxID=184585 RepID=UPI002FD09F8E